MATEVGHARRSRGRLAGPLLAAAMLAGYTVLALWPFRWLPPRWVDNGARVTPTGGVAFVTEGLVNLGPFPPWAAAAIRDDTFRLDLRVRAAGDGGPILNFGDWDSHRRNLALTQLGPDLEIILQTPDAPRGAPLVSVPGVFASRDWRNVRIDVRDNTLTVDVDHVRAAEARLPQRPLSAWRTDGFHHVVLGNQLSGRRPWLGEIDMLAVEAGGIRTDLLTDALDRSRATYAVNLKYDLILNFGNWADRGGNFLCFVPIGAAFVVPRRGWRPVLAAVIVCAAASAAVETLQLLFDRMPSINDWIMNTAGAAAGAAIAAFALDPHLTNRP